MKSQSETHNVLFIYKKNKNDIKHMVKSHVIHKESQFT